MAHWAEIDENNIVIRVTVGDNNDPAGDEGYQWLIDNLGGTWIKTSFNTRNGKRVNPETNEITDEPGFRGNYAGVGYTYNADLDAFIPPKPFESWIIDQESFSWKSSVEYPNDGSQYIWDEETTSWKQI